jgi:hypothetical protein
MKIAPFFAASRLVKLLTQSRKAAKEFDINIFIFFAPSRLCVQSVNRFHKRSAGR